MHVLQLLVHSGKHRVNERKAHVLSHGAKIAKLKQADKRMKKKKKKKQADHSSELISMPSVNRRRKKETKKEQRQF